MPLSEPLVAWLEIKDADGRVRTVKVEESGLSMGRAADNALPFPQYNKVSRYHAEIVPFEGRFVLLDQASRSGTLVNDCPVMQHELQEGDVIQLGPAPAPRMVFHLEARVPQPRDQPASSVDEPMSLISADQDRFLNPDLLAQATQAGQPDARLTVRLKALYEISSAMLAATSVDEVATRLMDLVLGVLPADRGAVLIRPSKNADPVVQTARQRKAQPSEQMFAPSRTITNRVVEGNVAVLSLDATSDDRFASGTSVMIQSVRSVLCAPISSKNHVWGACYLDMQVAQRRFNNEELEFLLAVSRQAGMALENLSLLAEQKKTFESLVHTLAHSIDARDPITAGHSTRVARYAEAIARYMGLSAQQQRCIWHAGLLHDYGKIATREAVLCKPGKLTPEEAEHIREHARHTHDILSRINFTSDMADVPAVASTHHERMDGKGYPFGYSGEQIPLGGRIIAVADVFDALTATRHYRKPMPLEEVLQVLEQGRNTQFDSAVLDAFLQYVQKEIIPLQDMVLEKRAQTTRKMAAVKVTDNA